jgi:hypothetical protein
MQKGGIVMATSSFDSVITINKKSADSLVDIIENENYNSVLLDTKCVVVKVNQSNIKEIFEKETDDEHC